MSKSKPISKAPLKAPIKAPVKVVAPSVKVAVQPVKPVAKPIVKPTSIPTVKPLPKPVSKPVIKSDLNKILTPVEKDTLVKTEVRKKKLMEVTPEHETYFVYLKQPLEYRRHLLESSRKILFCLRSHQKILLIRQRKLAEMNRLKTSVRELLYLNKQFNERLPRYNTEFLESTPSKDKVKPSSLKSAAARRPADMAPERTEMDRLEESLANIERKLKTLQ